MDEQNQNTQSPQEDITPVQPVQKPEDMVPPTQSSDSSVVEYASFWLRLLAFIIDSVLVGGTLWVLGSVLGLIDSNNNNPLSFLSLIYFIFMDYKYGATLGKMAVKIRVQDAQTGQNLDIVHAILREFVGKILSSIVFLLGYFWMIWDPKKQTWHDKISNSVVVKVK